VMSRLSRSRKLLIARLGSSRDAAQGVVSR